MSPTTYRKRSEASWTPKEKERLWNMKSLYTHLSWDEFHRLGFFPGRTDHAVQIAWSRLRKERGQPRLRRGRGSGNANNASSTSVSAPATALVRRALRNVPARRSSAPSTRAQQRLRRPSRLRQFVRNTGRTEEDSENESPHYNDTSTEDEDGQENGVTVAEQEEEHATDDVEMREGQTQPTELSNALGEAQSSPETTGSAIISFALPRRQSSARSNTTTTPTASTTNSNANRMRVATQSANRSGTPRSGPSPNDPPESTGTLQRPPPIKSLLHARHYLKYSTEYMARYCEGIEKKCKENHEHLPGENKQLKAEVTCLQQSVATATKNQNYMKTLYREQLKKNEVLEQQIKEVKKANERLAEEVGRLNSASRAFEGAESTDDMADYLRFEA
ncbi:hypothetical protein BDV06DRAFT_228508 [Aspergillus oleicola]